MQSFNQERAIMKIDQGFNAFTLAEQKSLWFSFHTCQLAKKSRALWSFFARKFVAHIH